jgi:hypothetical protein
VPPLVSVVIPTHERARVIAETIDSALAQSYPSLEIIVVDDGSTDTTRAIVTGDRYRGRVTYVRQPHAGLAAARNAGLRRATGTYVAWLDTDDLWRREKLALQVAWLEQRPGHAVIGSDFSAFDADGYFDYSHVAARYAVVARTPGGLAGLFPHARALVTGAVPHAPADLPVTVRVYSGHVQDHLVLGNCLHPSTVLFRRDAALRAGELDPALRRDADWEFLLRLGGHGRVAFVDRPLARHRYAPGEATRAVADAQLADLACSRVQVLERLLAARPHLGERRAFRQRLGAAHAEAARTLADGARGPAARHLLASLRWAHLDGQTARAAAKLCLPHWAIEALRQRPTS